MTSSSSSPAKNGTALPKPMTAARKKFNNSDNMHTVLQQPFVTLSPGKKPVGDPKSVTRSIPIMEKSTISTTKRVHCKGNTCTVGTASFYIF